MLDVGLLYSLLTGYGHITSKQGGTTFERCGFSLGAHLACWRRPEAAARFRRSRVLARHRRCIGRPNAPLVNDRWSSVTVPRVVASMDLSRGCDATFNSCDLDGFL